jgi:2-polyprenyl-6-methoxyphenol hydroxylase-like FAD-dependent oxidoreductase
MVSFSPPRTTSSASSSIFQFLPKRPIQGERYIQPLLHVTKAVRIGFCQLQPRLKRWVYGPHNRIVLVGDAAHPPVPYTGQGAQQGIEDAGTIALLMKKFCRNDPNIDNFDWSHWNTVVKLYENIRIPRAAEVSDMSLQFGSMQFRRAMSEKYDIVQGEKIQRQVFFHQTLPCLLPGATGDYRDNVEEACRQVRNLLPIVKEEEEE